MILFLLLLLTIVAFDFCTAYSSNTTSYHISHVSRHSNTRQRFSKYEVWASDQSNTVPGQPSLGIKGGYLWIYDSADITRYMNRGRQVRPISCTPDQPFGPCDMMEVFPQGLKEFNKAGETGNSLADLEGFGRLHGALGDRLGRYVNVNLFTLNGGYVGIVDAMTKEAVALFRVTKFKFGTTTPQTLRRSVHMSSWSYDGTYLIVDNLHGKAIERINLVRDRSGKITDASFDQSASLGLGSSMSVDEGASVFLGSNAFGNRMIGSVTGVYSKADLGDLTPNGVCKENGCVSGADGQTGGRPNNVPICPITSRNDKTYITLGGGGLFVADFTTTPMAIVAEYGNAVVYGAGCGGVQARDLMYLNAGVSASATGFDQSMFAIFSFRDSKFPNGEKILSGKLIPPENRPMPTRVYQDHTNTLSNGNVEFNISSDMSGQLPGTTTRRDSHGAAVHPNGKYVYFVDRIQNNIEVFATGGTERYTFDLTSQSGKDGRAGVSGPCYTESVLDDARLPLNDPTPDLMSETPDGKYLMIALRGPAPVSVPHAAQGSCPGIGIVKISNQGKSGRMVAVIRTNNYISDNTSTLSFTGGVPYIGKERSDIHGVFVVSKATSF